MNVQRRTFVLSGLVGPWSAANAELEAAVARTLRQGGVAAVFRHAQAPGTFDPPGFELADCRTQRNLDDEGHAQARRLGARFAALGLRPTRVLSSPWCRCLDTARDAFGPAEAWAALGSPDGRSSSERAAQQQALHSALAAVPTGGFEVWVTHNFVIADLVAVSTASAEGVVLRGGASVQLLHRLPAA
jgi:phosphohistidine phosphatase SixA